VGGRRSQRPGPSPTLVSLGPSHHRRHKSRVSLRGPPCALGVSGIPYGEVRDSYLMAIVAPLAHGLLKELGRFWWMMSFVNLQGKTSLVCDSNHKILQPFPLDHNIIWVLNLPFSDKTCGVHTKS
jgi:hypothetical protein